jgi:hypothetical protein
MESFNLLSKLLVLAVERTQSLDPVLGGTDLRIVVLGVTK